MRNILGNLRQFWCRDCEAQVAAGGFFYIGRVIKRGGKFIKKDKCSHKANFT